MSVETKQKPSKRADPRDVWSDIAITRSRIDHLLQEAKQDGDLKPAQEALEELKLKTSYYEQLLKKQAALQALFGRNLLGAAAWKQSLGVEVNRPPPLPMHVTEEFVHSDCPLHPGKKIKDTHLLVYIPQTVNGEFYSVYKLESLCAEGKLTSVLRWGRAFSAWTSSRWSRETPEQSEWILVPKGDPDPGSVPRYKHFRDKTLSDQLNVYDRYYKQDYRAATALEVITALTLNFLSNDERLLSDCYLRTGTEAPGGRAVVGMFREHGLEIYAGNNFACSYTAIGEDTGFALTRR